MHYNGLSMVEIGEKLGVARTTIYHWRASDVWREEWQRLEDMAKAKAEQTFLNHMDLLEGVSVELAELSRTNIQSAIKGQRAIADALQGIALPKKIETLDELSVAMRTLQDITKMAGDSWAVFQEALNLQDFLKENQQSPEISFEDYSEEDIAAIRAQTSD